MPRPTTPKKIARYGWRFIVIGSGHFPTDMLRYDECFPVDEGEARKMLDLCPSCAEGSADPIRPRTVRLERWSGHPNPPTEPRWASQGWHIVRIGHHYACDPIRGGVAEAADFRDDWESQCKILIENWNTHLDEYRKKEVK